MCRCQAALQALQERERRLVTEVADLRTEVQGSFGSQSATSTSPHPVSQPELWCPHSLCSGCPGVSGG